MAKQWAMHEKGKTTNLTVNQLLESLFKCNEKADRLSKDKWTDSMFADFIKQEFDNSAVTLAEVNRRRRQYNMGTGVWVKRGPASYADADHNVSGDRPFSYQYDSAGNKLAVNYTAQKQAESQSGVALDEVKQLIADEVSGAMARQPKPQSGMNSIDVQCQIDQEFAGSKLKQQIAGAIDAAFATHERPTITITVPERNFKFTMDGKKAHKAFQKVMLKVKAGVPILLVGPAGSGKTYLASQIALALGLPFTFNSMSEGVSESSLLGRTLPDDKGNWVYKPAPFVTSFANGGVHLLDEIDAADPNLLVQINAAIANGKLSVPFKDGHTPFERHAQSIIIAAANTYGNGADRQYVGRNQLDAATVNRFTMGTVEIDYDRDLETAIAQGIVNGKSKDLLAWAWGVRDGINSNKLRRIMSTRNIEDCAKCLVAGESMDDVKATYFLGWTADEKAKVTQVVCTPAVANNRPW
jgi:hypothetical protein